MKVQVKPLTVNRAWQGRRFKTKAYKQYEKDVLTLLRPMTVPDGDLGLWLIFGLSNMQSDVDNPVKPFVDILQKKYGFNDRRIFKMVIEKVKVKKGLEFTEFDFRKIDGGGV